MKDTRSEYEANRAMGLRVIPAWQVPSTCKRRKVVRESLIKRVWRAVLG